MTSWTKTIHPGLIIQLQREELRVSFVNRFRCKLDCDFCFFVKGKSKQANNKSRNETGKKRESGKKRETGKQKETGKKWVQQESQKS